MSFAERVCLCALPLLVAVLGPAAGQPGWRLAKTLDLGRVQGVRALSTPGLDRVLVSGSATPGQPDGGIVAYAGDGSELWRFSAADGAALDLAALSDGGNLAVACTRVSAAEGRAPDYLLLSAAGALVARFRGMPGDESVSVSEDGGVLLVWGRTPRLLGRDGSLALDLRSVTPPWPPGMAWQGYRGALAKDGTWVLLLPRAAGATVYHVASDGTRAWELTVGQPGRWDELALPASSPDGTLWTLFLGSRQGGGELRCPRGQAGAAGGAWSQTIDMAEQMLSILEVYSGGIRDIPGDHARLLWRGETARLAATAQSVPGAIDVCVGQYGQGAVWAVSTGRDVSVSRVSYRGVWQGSTSLPMPYEARWRVAAGGDPPLVLAAAADGTGRVTALLFSADGEMVGELELNGADVRAVGLSGDGQRAIVDAGDRLHILTPGSD